MQQRPLCLEIQAYGAESVNARVTWGATSSAGNCDWETLMKSVAKIAMPKMTGPFVGRSVQCRRRFGGL